MTSNSKIKIRKTIRDFKGRIELMNKTDLKKVESLFLELYELGLQDYLRREKENHPEKSHKEIILQMYQFHDKLRGKKN